MKSINAHHTCPICGERGAAIVRYPAEGGATRALGFREIAVCSACGLGIALPRVEQAQLDAFYLSGAYWEADYLPQEVHEKAQAELRVAYCIPVLGGKSPRTVLDVGAGHGWTADWLDRCFPGGIDRFDFVEPDDRRAAGILEKPMPFPVVRLDRLESATSPYDLIFLNHVLEHVADPVSMAARIAGLLAPEGIAYVEMPNSDYRFKRDVFPHTLFFTAQSLQLLAQRIGVEQLCCEAFGRWPPDGHAPGYWTSRALQVLFAYTARWGPWPLQRGLDRVIWRYQPGADGIWLRWVFRPRR